MVVRGAWRNGARKESFTTLLGAELSSADWDAEDVFWVNAIGLPAEFPAPAARESHAAVIRRAAEAGAYNVLLHPHWRLTVTDADGRRAWTNRLARVAPRRDPYV